MTFWYAPRRAAISQWCQDSKPVWVHLETGTIASPDAAATPEQVKAEVWMAIIHGASGIDYFVHQFKPKFNEHALLDNPAMLAAVTTVNKRITSLARVLNSETVVDGVVVESTNPKTPVHAMVKRKDGATYVSRGDVLRRGQGHFPRQGLGGNPDGRSPQAKAGRSVCRQRPIHRRLRRQRRASVPDCGVVGNGRRNLPERSGQRRRGTPVGDMPLALLTAISPGTYYTIGSPAFCLLSFSGVLP